MPDLTPEMLPALLDHRLPGIDLPAGLEESLHRLMRALGLAFGAIDLIQTPDGEYVFLEINPSGQWLWLDDRLDLGISDAVAGWLGGDHQP